MQKAFIKLIYNKDHTYPTEQLYVESNIFDPRQLYFLRLGLWTFANKNMLEIQSHTYSTRKGNNVRVPFSAKSAGQRCHTYIGPKLFNSLPDYLKQTNKFWICFNASQNFFLNVSSPYKTVPSIFSSSSSKSTSLTKTSYDCPCYATRAKGMHGGGTSPSLTEPLKHRAKFQSNQPYICTGGTADVDHPFPHTRGTKMDTVTKKDKTKSEGEDSEKDVMESLTTDSDASAGTSGTADTITAKVKLLGNEPRLSGAQKRKLTKARKMAEGTWTKEKPKRKTPNDPPTQGQKEKPGEGKRIRSDSQSPRQAKRPRSGKPQAGSYSEAAKGIKMAVIDRRHPDIILNQEQADLVQNKIVDAIDEAPSGSETQLQFDRTSFSGGVLWMTCANEATALWLRGEIGNLTGLWEDAALIAVEAKELPKRPKVLAFFPGPVEQEEKVRTRLGKQNPDLRVGGWILLSRKTEGEGANPGLLH
ncbi:hypothetical protein NQ318_017230 [Aromia moschata]|uniref:DUF4780 domain-containing protein n=1 Tax=Aromia moschata TaxID=1265417 RepID=A0AAV8YMB6_9CUCU|nr:hypothetical protein NQ318_017230 [Aromia moschata]